MLNQNTLFFENIRVEHFTHPNKVKIPPPSCPLKTTLRCPSILWPVQVLPLTSLKRRKSWENLRNLRSIFGGFYPFFWEAELAVLGPKVTDHQDQFRSQPVARCRAANRYNECGAWETSRMRSGICWSRVSTGTTRRPIKWNANKECRFFFSFHSFYFCAINKCMHCLLTSSIQLLSISFVLFDAVSPSCGKFLGRKYSNELQSSTSWMNLWGEQRHGWASCQDGDSFRWRIKWNFKWICHAGWKKNNFLKITNVYLK